MSDSSLLDRFECAQRIASEAGLLTLSYFRREIEVEKKPDDTPVTVADREAELLVRERLADAFPDDGILGEEFPEKSGTSPYRWVVDPIDGTKSFVCGVPLYSTLLGVEFEGRGIIGVIELPALGESVAAAEGNGAWYTDKEGRRSPARVGDFTGLSDGLFTTSERATFDMRGAGTVYDRLESAAWTTRTWGDGYGYALVATGRAVAMVDPMMNFWDAVAIQPILREAGGVFTDWGGQPTVHSGEGIGTTPAIIAEIVEITRHAPAVPRAC